MPEIKKTRSDNKLKEKYINEDRFGRYRVRKRGYPVKRFNYLDDAVKYRDTLIKKINEKNRFQTQL